MNLYHLSSRYQQLLDQDEYTPEEMEELEHLHGNLENEFISRGKYIRNLESELVAVNEAIEEMKERAKKLSENSEKQRNNLAERMLDNNMPIINKSPLFILKAKQNPVKVDDFNKDIIPSSYWYEYQSKPVLKVNKDAIKIDIERGIDVPGAKLIRTLKIDFK